MSLVEGVLVEGCGRCRPVPSGAIRKSSVGPPLELIDVCFPRICGLRIAVRSRYDAAQVCHIELTGLGYDGGCVVAEKRRPIERQD